MAATASRRNVVEAQVTAPNFQRVFFRPVGRLLRGSVDFASASMKAELNLKDKWPEPVPGLIVGVDLDTGEKYVRDPIHDQEHFAVKERIRNRGFSLPPEREKFDGESVVTWLYWIKNEIDAGTMRLTAGTIPDLDTFPDKPRMTFIRNPVKSDSSKLADAMNRMADAVEQNSKLLRELLGRSKG